MMNFDFHVSALKKLCRCCGNRLQKTYDEKRKIVHVRDCRKEISLIFNINTWEDNAEQHPCCICNNCARKVRHLQAGTRQYTSPNSRPIDWPPHPRTQECKVCSLFCDQQKVKRKTGKRKSTSCVFTAKQDLPFSISDENIFATTHDSTGDISPNLDFLGRSEKHAMFTCAICQCIISLPSVQTPCEHYFCSLCLSNLFKYNKSSTVKCPICQHEVSFSDVRESPRLLHVQIKSLDVVCWLCSSIGKLQNLLHHSCVTAPKKRNAQ